MGTQTIQSEMRGTGRLIITDGAKMPAQLPEGTPITRGPWAKQSARRAKVPTVKQMNQQIAANRDELMRRARENTRRLTGSDTF
jgi:hypothetical protein